MNHQKKLLAIYKSVGIFLKHQKKLIFITSAIFLASIIIAAVAFMQSPQLKSMGISFINQVFAGLSPDDTNHELFSYIFSNNLRAMTTMILQGLIPFLFLPLLTLALNGSMITLAALLSAEKGMSIAAFWAYILPHGIIEIPLIILSCSLGFYLCLSIIKALLRGASLKEPLKNIAKTYFIILLPGILLAALIEAYITPLIGGLFM